jgi:hypothetical protein
VDDGHFISGATIFAAFIGISVMAVGGTILYLTFKHSRSAKNEARSKNSD